MNAMQWVIVLKITLQQLLSLLSITNKTITYLVNPQGHHKS